LLSMEGKGTFELLSMENSVTLLLSTSFVDTAFIIMELNMM
jgi:hypothetical protein